jgi:hypothetical protein
MTAYPTVPSIYKHMKLIDKQLKDAVTTGPPHVASIVKLMQEKYNKYWSKMEDFAEITAVFDPRFKLAIIEFMLLKEISSEAAEESLS